MIKKKHLRLNCCWDAKRKKKINNLRHLVILICQKCFLLWLKPTCYNSQKNSTKTATSICTVFHSTAFAVLNQIQFATSIGIMLDLNKKIRKAAKKVIFIM